MLASVPALPTVVLSAICEQLAASGYLRTLANFQLAGKEAYRLASLHLYHTVYVDANSFKALFEGLDFHRMDQVDLGYTTLKWSWLASSLREGSNPTPCSYPNASSHERKLALLKLLKHLVLEGFPRKYLREFNNPSNEKAGEWPGPDILSWLRRVPLLSEDVWREIPPEAEPGSEWAFTAHAKTIVPDAIWELCKDHPLYSGRSRDELTPTERAELMQQHTRNLQHHELRRRRGCLFPSLTTLQIDPEAYISLAPIEVYYTRGRWTTQGYNGYFQLFWGAPLKHLCVRHPQGWHGYGMTVDEVLNDLEEGIHFQEMDEWIGTVEHGLGGSVRPRLESISLHGFDPDYVYSHEALYDWHDAEVRPLVGVETAILTDTVYVWLPPACTDPETELDVPWTTESESNYWREMVRALRGFEDTRYPGLSRYHTTIVLADFDAGKIKRVADEMWAELNEQLGQDFFQTDHIRGDNLRPPRPEPCKWCGVKPLSHGNGLDDTTP